MLNRGSCAGRWKELGGNRESATDYRQQAEVRRSSRQHLAPPRHGSSSADGYMDDDDSLGLGNKAISSMLSVEFYPLRDPSCRGVNWRFGEFNSPRFLHVEKRWRYVYLHSYYIVYTVTDQLFTFFN